ncbi:MAG: nitrite reductase small subunit NirD [Balneolales bacterium]
MTIIESFQKITVKQGEEPTKWIKAAPVEKFPKNGGVCIKYNDLQIAVFNFSSRGEWYASQNLCPHKMEMALSRGLLGSQTDLPKVACPYHKRAFSLETGECFNGEEDAIATFPVKVEQGFVYVGVNEQ